MNLKDLRERAEESNRGTTHYNIEVCPVLLVALLEVVGAAKALWDSGTMDGYVGVIKECTDIVETLDKLEKL